MQILSDSEVKLVEPRAWHEEPIYACIEASRDKLTNLKWSADATLESTRKFMVTAFLSDEVFRVIENNGEPCGTITLRPDGDNYIIGYWLNAEHQGRGIASEAVRQILQLADRNVYAIVRFENERSQRLLVHAGFKMIGIDTTSVIYRWEPK